MTAAEIKSARFELGHSLTGMAEALGMNRRTVMRMEAGEWAVHDRTAKQVSSLLLMHRLKESVKP